MTKLIEAVGSVTKKNGKWRAKIIAADVRGSSAYYPGDVLKENAHKFAAGVQMFRNHLSESEKWERPEGNVNDLVGVLGSDAVYEADNPEGPGLYSDLNIFEDQKAWLKERAPYIGLSIRASGVVKESDDGTPILESITEVHSVDVVTKAGAGGKFVSLAESARAGVLTETSLVEDVKPESKEPVMDKEIAEAFDVLRNDLLAAITEAAKPAKVEEVKVEEVKVEKVEEAKKVDAGAFADALVEADLSKTSRARVIAAVDGGADFTEAIASEKELVASVLAEAKVEKPAAKEFEGNVEEAKGETVDLGTAVWG